MQPLAEMSDNTGSVEGKKASSPGQRQPYAAPSLKVFGPVGALTQSGSGVDSENNPPMGAPRRMA